MKGRVARGRSGQARFDPQALLNSRLGVGLALGLGRNISPKFGYRLAGFIAYFISRRKDWGMVKAVRANQWVVHQGKLSSKQLDQVVQSTFRHTAHCLYDLYHNLDDPEAIQELIHFSPQAQAVIQHGSGGSKRGLIVVGVHMSNFDFVMQSAGMLGLRALAISVPQPGGGYQWQNELRRRKGIEIVPGSRQAIRQALERLSQGGVVIAGIDRPIPNPHYRPLFFGRPANVPVTHVSLALKANVPVIVIAAIMRPDGVYEISASDPLFMQKHPDRREEILLNAGRILAVGEQFIRQAPRQWAMFYPLWPDVTEDMLSKSPPEFQPELFSG